MDKAKQRYKEARSSLRLLLRHREAVNCQGVDQFKRVNFNGSDYIYNDRAGNIIATIRDGRKGTLIRYRANSHYADILSGHAAYLKERGSKSVALPSTHVGRWSRRINQMASRISPRSRSQALDRLRLDMQRDRLFDGLTADRRELRAARRAVARMPRETTVVEPPTFEAATAAMAFAASSQGAFGALDYDALLPSIRRSMEVMMEAHANGGVSQDETSPVDLYPAQPTADERPTITDATGVDMGDVPFHEIRF